MNKSSEILSATSANNVWIMCNSTSHPGLKFYVNKSTGIKVWNITDTEIALAEKAGNNNPEPPSLPTMEHSKHLRVYNKQIINNQFPSQMSNVLVKPAPLCSPFNIWDNPQNLPPHLQPQMYQMVPANIAPVMNQIEAPNILGFQQMLPVRNNINYSVPYFAHQYAPNQSTQHKTSKSAKYRKNKWKQKELLENMTSDINNFSSNVNDLDLRKKLVRKKRFSTTNNQEDCGMKNSIWNDINNLNEYELEDTSIQINLTPLKTLTNKNPELDQWYIVVEKEVILDNFNYLNNMAAADPDSHLLVPRHVISELQSYVSESNDLQARRILRFLTQQIESGLVKLGEEFTSEGLTHKSILTCVKLASQNNNVVLISNDEETLKFKPNSNNIYVFTMQDIKNILANRSVKLPRDKSPTLFIKIVVPNNSKDKSVTHEDELPEKSLQNNLDSNEIGKDSDCIKCALGAHDQKSPQINKTKVPKVPIKIVRPKKREEKSDSHKDYLPEKPSHKCIATTELTYSNVQTKSSMEIPSVTSSKCGPISPKTAEISVEPSSVLTRNTPNVLSVGSPKIGNQNTRDIPDDSSVIPSVASYVSLNTVRKKIIISMNSLGSNRNTAENITSNRQISNELTPPKIQRTKSTSTSASCDNDNTSEASVKRDISENVIVEKSPSSVKSKSSHCEKNETPIKGHMRKVALRTIVMFEITCQSMEDVLKTRSDEWVFRFVQIMEEVLRVKLQEKLPFENKEPAPWDLQEAARCIIKKFSNNFNVVDAANKLSFILYKTSDEHGKIAVNIQPADYMEMYSYGVFLVETFMDISANCVEKGCKNKQTNKLYKYEADRCSCYEVKTASESLKRLLYDIHNANLETFVDHPTDLAIINEFDYDNEAQTIDEIQAPEVTEIQQEETQCNVKDYLLQSHKRKYQIMADDEIPPKVTITDKGIKSVFLDSQLQKNNLDDFIDLNNAEQDKMFCSIEPVNASEQVKTNKSVNDPKDIIGLKCHFNKDDNILLSPSKVFCNFTINEEFERKVKANMYKKDYNIEENKETDRHDNIHNIMPAENVQDDYNPIGNEKKYYNVPISKQTDEVVDSVPTTKEIVNDILTANNTVDMLDVNEHYENNYINNEANEKFMCFMGRLARGLGDVFTQVKLLCDTYIKEVKIKNSENATRVLHHKVELACLLIGNIHDSLESISKRELQDKDINIQMLLKIANFDDYVPDDKLCLQYRHMITKCKKKAEEFHDNLRNILKLVRG